MGSRVRSRYHWPWIAVVTNDLPSHAVAPGWDMSNETSTRRAKSRANSKAMSGRFLGVLRQFGSGPFMGQLDACLRVSRLTGSLSPMAC